MTDPLNSTDDLVVAALYHFARLPDFREWRAPLTALCEQHSLLGTLLLAEEGINGTVAGSRSGVDALLAHLRADPRMADLVHKESRAAQPPFRRLKVRLKKEIVSMGVPGTDPNHLKGSYLDADDWNRVINDPDVLVIDTRNEYEIAAGSFPGAVDPKTRSFREFPAFVDRALKGREDQPVAMFCTGGIRCEKSTAYLKSLGFRQVYHLRGGILNYLDTVKPEDNQWQGECFVFDERVSVDRHLAPGRLDLCRACRRPLTQAQKDSPDYEPAVSCPQCIGEYSEAQRQRFRERKRQVDLADARGERHLGQRLDSD